MSGQVPLAPLHVGTLTRVEVLALVRDLEARATVHSVRPKRGPRARAASADVTLREGVALLLDQTVRALQVRYAFEDQAWCDTVVAAGPDAFRIVRIEERFAGVSEPE